MIVGMRHLDLVCVASERDATLERLRELGVVHLDLGASFGASVQAAAADYENAEKAVRLILKARGDSKPMASAISVDEVLALDAERSSQITDKDRLEREIKTYEPYGDFDPALARKLLDRGIDLRDRLPVKLPEMRLSAMREKLVSLNASIEANSRRIASADEKAILSEYPALQERMQFEQARELLKTRGEIAVVSGWVPENAVASLRQASTDAGWGILLRDPAEGETPPTLINPPKFVRPVKALFEGLGIAPAYNEADVSVPFMGYFSLFFAMLVGDGAYGAIFLAATLAFRKKLPRSWFVLMTVFSSATVLWGVLSNTWFGEAIPWLAGLPTARWLAGEGSQPGREYDNMMFLCFTIGVSHLMLARIWNGICRLNDRSCLSEFGWAGMVLFMYVLTNSIVGIFGGVPTWCYWMFGASFLTVFIQAKGMDKGMLFLNAMSVLGDIISYVRLFAVGLASVKVAQNFNAMAIDLGLPLWIKWLPLVLILLVGHGLNLAMAGLSVLVHAVRLNTLEFSNHKGISWAGYAFRPFKKTKE